MARDRKTGAAQVLEGEDLKTALKRLSKGPMKFAFGFSNRKNPILVIHKSRTAQSLRNELKSKMGVTTATHGTATEDGKALVLDVEGPPIPSMDKLVKVLLRKEKVAKYTEARVTLSSEAGTSADAEPEAKQNGAAAAGTDRLRQLRALQIRIQAKDADVRLALRDLATGGGGDTATLTEYGALCARFATQARDCGDTELIAFGKDCVERAKKVIGVAKRAGAANDERQSSELAPGLPPEVPDGTGLEVAKGDDSVGLKRSPDGTTLTIKQERDLAVVQRNFAIGVIPCYTKGSLKASIEGSVTVGSKTGGALSATSAGSLELGAGYSGSVFTVGPYGSVSLSASHSCSLSYSDKEGLDVQPFTFSVKGSGKVGVKIELEDGSKLDVEQECFDWELFVVHVGRYANDAFEFIDVKAGKDLMRLIAALQSGGPKIEEFVGKHAPEFVKKGAEKGAKWVAEDDDAGKIADVVDEGVKIVEKKTGVDVGAGVEKVIQSLIDGNGETSDEATARFTAEAKTFDACRDQLRAVLAASGLRGELRPFRKDAEVRAIVDVWQAETELVVKGKPSPGKWIRMVQELVRSARKLKAQQEAYVRAQKQEEDEYVKAALAAMKGARTAAQGSGNVLNNRLKKVPNAEGKQYFDKGWRKWATAEEARGAAAQLNGRDKAQKASQAKALYEQARADFQTGNRYAQ